jgi:hypothetical protein
MVRKAVISTKEGEKYRVLVDGRISAPIPRVRMLKKEKEESYQEELAVGDIVAVVIFGGTLADGLILGKVVEE